jgi:hypothetical protein
MQNDELDTKGLDSAELAGFGNELVKQLRKDLDQASFRDKVTALKVVSLSLTTMGATARGPVTVEDMIKLLEQDGDG